MAALVMILRKIVKGDDVHVKVTGADFSKREVYDDNGRVADIEYFADHDGIEVKASNASTATIAVVRWRDTRQRMGIFLRSIPYASIFRCQ